MQYSIGRDRCERMKSAEERRDGIGRTAAPEQKDMLGRDMPRQLERDHAAKRRATEIEWFADLNLRCESCSVVRQRLACVCRQNPLDRPNVANSALSIEQSLIAADP
jgi:hypothetical protein